MEIRKEIKHQKSHLKTPRGFTIVEVMIALFIASVTFGGYVAGNILTQRITEEMNERTLAIQDANRAIEQIRNVSRTGTFPQNVIAAYPNGGTIIGSNNLANEDIRISYENTSANPLKVTITVTWQSYTQRLSSTAITTYVTQR